MNSDKCLLLVLSLAAATAAAATTTTPPAQLEVKNPIAIFAFGDSILDPGNNNDIRTPCHSNHKPYGVSLQGRKPSGRFSDGKLPMDILISNLGIKNLLPAYSDKTVNEEGLLTGVSFAAACTGLDKLTAEESNVASMGEQLKNFKEAVERMQKIVGMYEVGRILDGALFVVAAGSNDMINNFYMTPFRKMFTLAGYQDMLLKNLESFLKRLVGLGAVRLGVAGLPPIGCLPAEVTMHSVHTRSRKRECYPEHNADSQVYNSKLQSIIYKLQSTIPRCKFAYVDIYNPTLDMIRDPKKYGFENTHEGCCGNGAMEVGLLCNEMSERCNDPSKYIFWDAAHPTQAAYDILVKQFQNQLLSRLMS